MSTKATTKSRRKGRSANFPMNITGGNGGGRGPKFYFNWGVAALIAWLLFVYGWYLKGVDWTAHNLYWIDWQIRRFFD